MLQLWKQEAVERGTDWRRGLALLAHTADQGGVSGRNRAEAFEGHWASAVGHLRRRMWEEPMASSDGGHEEMHWASALWLGRLLHDLRPDKGATSTAEASRSHRPSLRHAVSPATPPACSSPS